MPRAADMGNDGMRRWISALAVLPAVWAAPLWAQTEPVDAPANITPVDAPAESIRPAKPVITAENAMENYRASIVIGPRRCSDVGSGDEILVCGNRDFDAAQRLPFSRVARAGENSGPVRGEVPRAGDLSLRPAGRCGVLNSDGSCTKGVAVVSTKGGTGIPILGWLQRAVGLAAEPVPTGDYQQEDIDGQDGALDD